MLNAVNQIEDDVKHGRITEGRAYQKALGLMHSVHAGTACECESFAQYQALQAEAKEAKALCAKYQNASPA